MTNASVHLCKILIYNIILVTSNILFAPVLVQDKNLLNSDTSTLHGIDISKATVSDKYLTALNAYTAKTWDQSQHRATQVTFNFSRISLCSVMTQPLVTHCSVYLCTCVSSVSVLPLLQCLDDGWVVWQYLHKNICRQSYRRLFQELDWKCALWGRKYVFVSIQYGPYSRTTSLLLLSLVWIWIFMTFFMFCSCILSKSCWWQISAAAQSWTVFCLL